MYHSPTHTTPVPAPGLLLQGEAIMGCKAEEVRALEAAEPQRLEELGELTKARTFQGFTMRWVDGWAPGRAAGCADASGAAGAAALAPPGLPVESWSRLGTFLECCVPAQPHLPLCYTG